jgi:hypothetical protein
MKKFAAATILTGLLSSAGIANAIQITDTVNAPNVYLTADNNTKSSYSYSHVITGPADPTGPNGFIPLLDVISFANLDIYMHDNNDRANEKFKITLDLDQKSGNYTVTSGTDTTKTSFEVLTYLQTDGKLDVKISAQVGDFYFDQSVLDVTYAPPEPNAPVPEPGTMMMLGAGFLGLAVYGKRRRNA